MRTKVKPQTIVQMYTTDRDDFIIRYLGNARLKTRCLHKETFSDRYHARLVMVNPPSHAEMKNAIRSVFNDPYCGHEHDCCGCWFSRAYDILQVSHNIWEFGLSHYANV